MRKTARTLSVVLMTIGIIVLAGCKKEENDNGDNNQLGRISGIKAGSVWAGGKSYSFAYEGDTISGYLSSRIYFIEGDAAEFRLEGLPEGTINRRVGFHYSWYESYFDFDGNYVLVNTDTRRSMEVKLNSSVCPNCGPKTQALFDQNNNLIPIQLSYAGDSSSIFKVSVR